MKKWGKPEGVIAQKIEKDQLPGMFHKEIFLENDEVALVRRQGAIVEEVTSGKHQIKGDFTDLILVDTQTKTLRQLVENLLTADDNNVSCDLEIRFDVYLPEKLARNLLAAKNILTIDELYSELYNELIAKVLSPIIRGTNISDLYGNKEVIDNITIAFETELKKTLETWGIELVNLSLMWKFPENYQQYIQSRGLSRLASRDKEIEHGEELKEVVREKEIGKIKGKGEPTEEEVKSKLKKETLESEVKLNLRKKETAQDSQEALDALKLKEIMDKQKTSRKAKRKELGVEDDKE